MPAPATKVSMSSGIYIPRASLHALLLTKLRCKPDPKGSTSECDWWRTSPSPKHPHGVVFPVYRPDALPNGKVVRRQNGEIEMMYDRAYVTDLLRQVAVMYGAPLAVQDDDPGVVGFALMAVKKN